VQVYAVGMLMATLRSGDEHRNRQDAPSSIGQSLLLWSQP
jgi:hypothetical protein